VSDRESEYLAAVLPLDPARHPTRILAARRAFLEGEAVAGEHPSARSSFQR